MRQFKADIFQALAHPTRIAVVELLRDGEVPAGVIFTQVGVEQANALYTSSEGGMRDGRWPLQTLSQEERTGVRSRDPQHTCLGDPHPTPLPEGEGTEASPTPTHSAS